MATEYAYEYGQRWNAKTPRRDIGYVVDKHHVGDNISDIIAEIERLIPKDSKAFTPAIRRECARYATMRHEKNRKLYRKVMGGF